MQENEVCIMEKERNMNFVDNGRSNDSRMEAGYVSIIKRHYFGCQLSYYIVINIRYVII